MSSLTVREDVMEQLLAALAEAAAAGARALPVPEAVLGLPLVRTQPELSLPPGPCEAVVVPVSGQVSGRFAIVVSGAVADAVTGGPLGAESLLAALRAAAEDGVAALGVAGDLQVGAADVVPADALFARTSTVLGVDVHSGGHHVASILLTLEDDREQMVPAGFEPLVEQSVGRGGGGPIDLLHGVEMGVTVELGRTRMLVKDLLGLAPGSVIELDRSAGSPVDVLVNGTLIARGEVVVIDDEFGVRISEIATSEGGAR